jgi:hypothetical protein
VTGAQVLLGPRAAPAPSARDADVNTKFVRHTAVCCLDNVAHYAILVE